MKRLTGPSPEEKEWKGPLNRTPNGMETQNLKKKEKNKLTEQAI